MIKVSEYRSHIRRGALCKVAQTVVQKRPTTPSKPIKGRVYYVNFPYHRVSLAGGFGGGRTSFPNLLFSRIGQSAKWDGKVPLGHAGVIIRDEQGHTKYYEYGRYANGNVGLSVNDNDGYFGNFRRRTVPDFKGLTDEQYVARLGKTFPDESRIELYGFDSDDIGETERFILRMAEDQNRDAYSFAGNNCGTVACKAVDAGRVKTDTQPVFPGLRITPSQNASYFRIKPVCYDRSAVQQKAPVRVATAAPSQKPTIQSNVITRVRR